MKRTISLLILGLWAIALACGGGRSSGTRPPASVGAYAALRWVPGDASYAITARTVREGQQGLKDIIDTFGVLGDVTVEEVSRELAATLLVDPLSPEAMAHVGVDVEGGFAIYSQRANPTVAVHLAAPQAFHEFVAAQKNLRTQSVVVDGVEVFTAPVPNGPRISWAIVDNDWLLVHFKLPGFADDGDSWFTASRKPGALQWTGELAWGRADKDPPVVGFVDVARAIAELGKDVPVVAKCMSSLSLGSQGIGKLALAMAVDGKGTMSAKVGLDVGATAADGITRSLLMPPEGWYTATAQVPIAAQWNVDLAAARGKLDECTRMLGLDLSGFDALGIRAGRAFVRSFDPDERKGTGGAALDLVHKDFFESQLEQVPLRSTFERKRTFGPYAGKSLAIPMFLTVDYVLTDQVALAGVGDGLLAVLVGKGGTTRGPVAELAVQPLGLTPESWTELLRLADVRNAKRVAERLLRWKEARVNLTIEGTRLVLAASGTRR